MRIESTILALAATAVSVPTVAADVPTATVRVEYRDLDLATGAGREELERRLERAARDVCRVDEARTGTRLPSEAGKRCLREVRASLDRRFAALIGGQPQG